ncbi:ACP phosphodiesterase [Halomonas chromatireducens]|uniref:Acyl carrier protein phosphodiesterase n=1 Tax=Halomonas chromatireducens TaxID=507626 RepID=A0A0X8HEL5_9GAMM|nr:ACP phosphodiesterase [Halomonas chromatireducens]AMD01169.1 Acyl carrier protein phosphodiesterase [Halomonas chromatireducens]
MNFLAHAWLARGGSDEFLYGNLIADGVKGSDLSAWSVEVASGIRHHRRVDAFVDGHPVIHSARSRAPQTLRRYTGIALDLMWDHFVARQLQLDVVESRLVLRCYHLLEQRPAPARLALMMPVLVEQDWLHRYVDFDFTCRAVRGIGQRLSGPNRLAELVPWLEADYAGLERDFQRLWPAVNDELEVTDTGKGSSFNRP